MGDLTEQQSALPVKVTGSDSSGAEDNYLQIDSVSGNRRLVTRGSIVDEVGGYSAEVTSARELRVTSETVGGTPAVAEKLYVTEAYVTTNVSLNARPVNGDFDVRKFKTKTFRIKNIGSPNKADVSVYASIDSGANFDFLVVSVPNLAVESSIEINEERGFTHMRVMAKSSVNNQSTTIESKGYALGA
jgi:hypothetical protein